MEQLQQQNVELRGEVNQLTQRLQQQQQTIDQQQQQIQQQAADPAAIFQAHLREDRVLKQQEIEENLIEKEVRRVEKCDGTEPNQVKCWLAELDLVPLGQRLEVARRTATRQLRRELERFITANANAAWLQVRAHILQAFVSADHLEALRKEVESFRQEMHENILSYNRKFRELADEVYPLGQRNQDQERMLIRAYGKGLAHDNTARKLVSNGWPDTLEAAMNRTAQLETAQEVYDHLGRPVVAMEVGSAAPAPQRPQPQPSLEVRQLKTHIAKLEAQLSRLRPPSRATGSQPRPRGDCYNCGKPGHIARECHGYARPSYGQAPPRYPGKYRPNTQTHRPTKN